MADPLKEQSIRANAILKDIYARNKIKPEWPIEKQVQAIQLNAMLSGMNEGSAWANPEERARAREEYARKGRTPEEVRERWEKSIYLLDPDTQKYMQGPGRDLDFLLAMNSHRKGVESNKSIPQGASFASTGTKSVSPVDTDAMLSDAVHYWDASNGNPLHRDAWYAPNYQSQSGILPGLLNATQNPDVPLGAYSNLSEVIPDRIRLGGSGEADTGQEAWEGAQAKRYALNRYRLSSPSPVLDLPDGATAKQKADRIRELRGLTNAAAVPEADQRWARWTKQQFGTSFVPPGWATDTLDFATSFADPTAAIPVGTTAAGAAKVAAKGAKIAGAGWVRPLLSGLAKSRLADFGIDMGVEQGIGHGLSGSLGGKPGRSWSQWALGDWDDPAQKSEEEVAKSREARRQLYDELKDDNRVSTADEAAYDRLQKAGKLPDFTRGSM